LKIIWKSLERVCSGEPFGCWVPNRRRSTSPSPTSRSSSFRAPTPSCTTRAGPSRPSSSRSSTLVSSFSLSLSL
jgi:hypothetical protein